MSQGWRPSSAVIQPAAHFTIDTGRPSIPGLVNMILMQLELAGLVDPSIVPSPVEPRVLEH